MSVTARVFVLSPARLDGKRARLLLEDAPNQSRPRAPGVKALVEALRSRDGAPIGEVFRFLSGLYFRGKLGYATRFARPPRSDLWIGSGVLVITSNRGLLPAESRICMEHLEAFAETDIHESEIRFRAPLVRDAHLLDEVLEEESEVVLLGSVAQAKYTSPLLDVFGDRLVFPAAFVGRGDMSRGGLMLRSVVDAEELAYVRVRGASVHGTRPPKLRPPQA